MGNLIVTDLAIVLATCLIAALCTRKKDRGFCICCLARGITMAAGIFLIRVVSQNNMARWETVMQNEGRIENIHLQDAIFRKMITVVWDSGQEKILYADCIRYSGKVSRISVSQDKFDTLAVIPEKYEKQ